MAVFLQQQQGTVRATEQSMAHKAKNIYFWYFTRKFDKPWSRPKNIGKEGERKLCQILYAKHIEQKIKTQQFLNANSVPGIFKGCVCINMHSLCISNISLYPPNTFEYVF